MLRLNNQIQNVRKFKQRNQKRNTKYTCCLCNEMNKIK